MVLVTACGRFCCLLAQVRVGMRQRYQEAGGLARWGRKALLRTTLWAGLPLPLGVVSAWWRRLALVALALLRKQNL